MNEPESTEEQVKIVPKRRIVLVGATGYTGNKVLIELLAKGERPTLAGRNESKMKTLAESHGVDLPVAQVDVSSADSLGRLFNGNDVVISTVGPFMKLGLETVTAAAHAGAHYFDSAGEAQFVRRAFELDSIAASRGASIVPAFGYDYVPGNLAGALALNRAGAEARHVEIGYFLTRPGHGDELQYKSTLRDAYTLTTGGTRQTIAASSAENVLGYRAPRPGAPAALIEEPAGRRVHTFDFAGVKRTAMTVGGSEHFGLPEVFPGLESVDVNLGWFGRWTRVMRAAAALTTPLVRLTKSELRLAKMAENLPGASREPDGDGRSLIIAVARDHSGRKLATTALTGPDPYVMTGSLLAWGAIHAASPATGLTPGVHGPVAGFGLNTLLQGAQQAGIHEAVQP
ncbi:saccharopine dehydrogenase NADP-binding domain-containing protein [Arthrobacter sp. ISL-72]|uniref:saccharopine dehydrogenase NADP-binding domain-containing protein n=1 Tax=Arthrobacter sp. ISL-72 TaxID=2819114 RepID=UPI001BEB5ED2|nr:saccharopine dehydrogenase NADP-binding domain-containing protein [Arthrobacter sp. ISL-72]MBT2597102.1 saccharopine dehydrogenase NADP-binding domain-containing protein [Arthrobacter sp. ISL-72]